MTALVTGGGEFIGRSVVRVAERGETPIVLRHRLGGPSVAGIASANKRHRRLYASRVVHRHPGLPAERLGWCHREVSHTLVSVAININRAAPLNHGFLVNCVTHEIVGA
jgi:hypothetical protein